MEKLDTKLLSLQQAHLALQKSLILFEYEKNNDLYETFRDSAIKRFELCYDLFWKTVRLYLVETYQIDISTVNNPRSVFKIALQEKILSETQFSACIDMIEERNRSTHTYDKLLAGDVVEHIPRYEILFAEILQQISKKSSVVHT
jgi:nucleotidyltransferase substrate binding protein (TIGR01987 family)